MSTLTPFPNVYTDTFSDTFSDRDHLTASDLLQCFSDQLARDDSVQDWQLRQAMQAVELYLNVYLPTKSGSPEPSAAERDLLLSDDEQAMRKMKELLKLRHYSPKTYKTYVGWVGRYFRYAEEQKLEWNSPDTVRAYLSYLKRCQCGHMNIFSRFLFPSFSILFFAPSTRRIAPLQNRRAFDGALQR